jgi:exopolysaccharide/PEP-CTERM locus tyrosine autokinase
MSIIEKAIHLANGKGARGRAGKVSLDSQFTPVRAGAEGLAGSVEAPPDAVAESAVAGAGSAVPDEGRSQRHGPRTSRTVTVDVQRLAGVGIAVATPGQDADRQVHARITEEFRRIKRPLLINAFEQGPGTPPGGNLVMVTSAVAGEGKTFCSVNIAMSIAMERDRRVLLVDADLQRPSVTQVLGISGDRGLVDLLEDPSLDLSEVLLQTDIPRLSVLPAGKRHSYGTELLASDAMKGLVAGLSERYPDRLVLFDSPPLLAATQAVVLAELAGQIVVVVAAGGTPQEAVTEALALLDTKKPVGLVLNRYPRMFQPEYYYG